MSKLVRRTILPILTLTIIICFLLIQTNNESINNYQSYPIFDSISNHFTFTKQEVETIPKQPLKKQDDEEHKLDPCTVYNPISKGYIDLSGLSSISNEGKALPFNAKGYDSGKNYTLGICSNPFKQHHDNLNEIQDNVNQSLIGGFYINDQHKYVSIGEFSTTPKFRGRKLTLTYENGSYCENTLDSFGKKLRKSTILSFTCDREISAKAQISFIGQINECSYFFEVRSHMACPTAAKEQKGNVILILLIFIGSFVGLFWITSFLKRFMKTNNIDKV
ncbi:unnamed protein product [Candida verbasci]|uniref:MRH domain-containing protein n=1 Tax=Candida verbasci TaxID=1227364 RepID=A0A9W4TWL6_9ASCO|nr:unnamed protein product [Candida verbasci]